MARLVPAVTRAFDILEIFLREDRPLTVPEIAERVALPRSTAHELVRTLAARHYLVAAASQPHHFMLGSKPFELGNAYAARVDLIVEGQEVARRVSAASEETVHLGILEGLEVVYIVKEDSSHTVRMVSGVGLRRPAHCTSMGKMLLSALPDDELACLLGDGETLPGLTPNSITSRAQLLEELSAVRTRGFAFDDRESNPSVRCVASPVFDHRATVVAAMSISIPVFRDLPERRATMIEVLHSGTEELSRRLGHRLGAATGETNGYQNVDPHAVAREWPG
jgi:IclR family KDG regulon transcriptional repressor